MSALRFLLALSLATAAITSPLVADPPAGKQWKLVFSDEFDGDRLDESKWSRSTSHGEAFCWNGAKGRRCDDHADVDGQGHFVVKVTRDAGAGTPRTAPARFVETNTLGESYGLRPAVDRAPFVTVAPSAPWHEKNSARWNLPEADDYIAAVVRTGPGPAWKEPKEHFEAQGFRLEKKRLPGAIADATLERDNRVTIKTAHVKRLALRFHPAMVDFRKPVTVVVNGVKSQHRLKPSLWNALQSFLRRGDWSMIYHAELTIECREPAGTQR